MKLNTKILIANTLLSVVIFLLVGVGMYYIIYDTVFEELDNHLLHHKEEIINEIDDDDSSLKELQDLDVLESYEWADITAYEGSVAPSTNIFSNIDTLRHPNKDANSEVYRRLTTAISVQDQHFTLKIYEEVAAWKHISKTILLSVLIGLLIWVLLLYLLNRMVFDKILTPFYDTVESLENISDPTDLKEPFPESTTYEIKVLNQALNTMMTEIRSSFEDQKKFIQNASHELLTPLSIIRQKAEKILAGSAELDEDTIKSADEIHQTTVRLSRLSNALLLISRVENQQFDLDEKVDIKGTVDQVLKELSDFISMKNIEITEHFKSSITVKGNKELLHSAIYNIIQNAIKFSPEGSTVQVSVASKSDRIHFSVRDQGPGIPENIINSVFDRFKKGKNMHSDLNGDNSPGLGLSIVQSICRLHGFTTLARSTKDGGAEVTIEF